jgi:hypothetical protein
MAVAGVFAGAAIGFVLGDLAGKYFPDLKMPGALPITVSVAVLIVVAIVASMIPAARAARVDVMQALSLGVNRSGGQSNQFGRNLNVRAPDVTLSAAFIYRVRTLSSPLRTYAFKRRIFFSTTKWFALAAPSARRKVGWIADVIIVPSDNCTSTR